MFVTGTDTAAGKTVLTALLSRYLHGKKVNVAALKPVCSGGRTDARTLYAALDGALALAEINPWHFQAPIAPVLAARLENKTVQLSEVLRFIRTMQGKFDIILVEGAGGLLSPLGEGFDSRKLIACLRPVPLIVAQNRLGVVNHLLLTLKALPKNVRPAAKIILMTPDRRDAATMSNPKLLEELIPGVQLFQLPRLSRPLDFSGAIKLPGVRRTLAALVEI